MHLVGFIIKIYHDARSSECQSICNFKKLIVLKIILFPRDPGYFRTDISAFQYVNFSEVLIHQNLTFVFTCCVLSVMFIHKFVIVYRWSCFESYLYVSISKNLCRCFLYPALPVNKPQIFLSIISCREVE